MMIFRDVISVLVNRNLELADRNNSLGGPEKGRIAEYFRVFSDPYPNQYEG